ncbi:AAA family ATPase [Aliarcobacter butzleri]|uniref:AAA family ATPase n=1 Tax=Aliarcobacter butzleri TaxID=28197 RepID=UPI0024DECC2F|nr:AAA family ATPase [Aliarcobacter butzleri]MDK2050880.1 AAA family ATPase [Aliarcobacter butzleri]
MELVYLWYLENDEKLGKEFNFGSKYICSYKEKKLIFHLNNEYIEDFYAKNVVISSIIGQNASGKSQLLKIIWNGENINHNRFDKFFAIIEIDNELNFVGATINNKQILSLDGKSNYLELDLNKKEFDIELINKKDSIKPIDNLTTYLYTNEMISLESISNNIQIANNQIFFSSYNQNKKIIESFAKKHLENTWLNTIDSYLNILNSDLESYEQSIELGNDWISKIRARYRELNINENMNNFEYNIKKNILTFGKFDLLRHSYNYEKILAIISDDSINWFKNFQKPSHFVISFLPENDLHNNLKKYLSNYPQIINIYTKREEYDFKYKIFIVYTLNWYLDILFDYNLPEDIQGIYLNALNIFEKDNLNENTVSNFFNYMAKEYHYFENKQPTYFSTAKNYFENLKKLLNNINSFNLDNSKNSIFLDLNKDNQKTINDFIHNYTNIVNEINISILAFQMLPIQSSGYYQIFSFVAQLYYDLKYLCKDKNNIILLLDEIEVFLHPDWQRQFIELLINFLSKNFDNKKFHVIIASHSPFILSDMIKSRTIPIHENIEALKQTFGTNIHTLLSDSFFLGENLMGSFSSKKIEKSFEKCKNILQENKEFSAISNKNFCEKDIEELYKIANLIGVDYLRYSLLNNLKLIEEKLNIQQDDNIEKEKVLQKLRQNPDWLNEL